MNGDHPEDNLLIARAFGRPEARASTMIGLDGAAGVWRVTDPSGEHELRVAWPGGEISERPEVRREVVALYRAACEKLGVTPREEAPPRGPHAAAHGGHPHHGAGHPHHRAEGDGSFASELRTVTWGDHGDSEHAGFMESIMRGEASIDDYTALVAQHYFLYVALENAAEQLASDPRYAPFHPAELVRVPSLEADLEFLIGDDWRERISPVPTIEAYTARIDEYAQQGWKPGILAHHYTRYLGDLSGGQMIARRVAQQHGLGGDGIAFYDFSALGDLSEFKDRYRAHLDTVGSSLSESERSRMIDDVREAYRFNAETFVDLSKASARVAA